MISKRVDVYIDSENMIISILESADFKSSNLYIVGVMEKFTAHAYLHKKNKDLVPKLSAILKDMKKEGLFEKYRSAANLKTYFND